jgi:DNA (cytosine-5)-methyltransferase 1
MGITVDSFAGGGGASTGIEMAGFRVDVAINHDPSAIAMHSKNHPETRHYCEDIWKVDPVEACKGQPVDFMWASPDCKHFSKASGGALKDRHIRGLAWVVLRWAGTVRPKCIIVENVEEFVTWGPVRKGKPVKSLAGTTYMKWRGQLENLGYHVESRELVAADYGAPTSRKRFFLIARCDGMPIVWPEPTHGRPDTIEVAMGMLKPWRTAAEIIDWSLPCPSIFDSKKEIKEWYGISAVRPLAPATMRRVARGLDKFTIKSARPFIVQGKFDNAPQSMDKPLTTITAVRAHEVIAPSLIAYHAGETARGQDLREPIMTVDASNRFGLSTAYLSEYYGNAQEGLDMTEPMRTVTARDREALTMAHIVKFKGQDLGQSPANPLQTLTASPGEFGIIKTRVERYAPGTDLHHWPEVRSILNEYCGYRLADDEVLLLQVEGAWYFIADIGLRMITAREAFRAQGFPDDYIIDFEWQGKPFPKSEQMAKAGNSVCPPLAAALVKANHPANMRQEMAG